LKLLLALFSVFVSSCLVRALHVTSLAVVKGLLDIPPPPRVSTQQRNQAALTVWNLSSRFLQQIGKRDKLSQHVFDVTCPTA
jgi:hypothetical protein